MPSVHANLVGGSNADLAANCASFLQMRLRLPATANVETDASADGTAKHECMTQLLATINDPISLGPEDMVGRHCYDRQMTEADIDEAIRPAWEKVFEVLDGEPIVDILLDKLVTFPGVPGCFGTLDVVIITPTRVIILDFKFGQIRVKALYPDPELGDKVNAQLQFYAVALLATFPGIARGKRIELAIIQPAAEAEALDRVVVTRQELTAFKRHMWRMVEEAFNPDAQPTRGEWCRFAPCKSICKLWTGPALTFARRPPQKPTQITPPPGIVTPYGRYLAEGLQLAYMIEPWIKAVREQAHAFMEAGGSVPAYKLVAKRPMRRWRDGPRTGEPELVIHEKRKLVAGQLRELGFEEHEIWEPQDVRSPAQMDKFAKKRGIEVPPELQPSLSSGNTVAPAIDPRPEIEGTSLIETFRASLKLVTGSKG